MAVTEIAAAAAAVVVVVVVAVAVIEVVVAAVAVIGVVVAAVIGAVVVVVAALFQIPGAALVMEVARLLGNKLLLLQYKIGILEAKSFHEYI